MLDLRGGGPAEPVGAVRIGELVAQQRDHRIEDFGRERRRRLIVEIDGHRARSAISVQAATKRYTSASLVSGPKLTRTTSPARASYQPMARRTWRVLSEPAEQALPAETEMPARSNWISWARAERPGMR